MKSRGKEKQTFSLWNFLLFVRLNAIKSTSQLTAVKLWLKSWEF